MNSLAIVSLIFIGGGFGSVSRYAVGKFALQVFDHVKFPIGTLIANTLACLILGLTLFLLKDKMLQNEWIKYLIIIGFCGGFSTFSTYSIDTLRLFQTGFFMLGILNMLISLALGIGILLLFVRPT